MNKQNVVSVPFMVLGIIFCVCLVAANLLETKVIQLGPISATAGLIVFPISYIINDCIAEVWGFRKARLIIWMGFIMNFMVVALGQLSVALPAAPFWEGEASHGKNFSARAVVSTLVGESADSVIFFPLAFGGLMPVEELAKLMIVQIVLKTLYEIIILPVTIRVVNYIKRVDNSDVYDENISYNILKIKEI